MGSVSWCGPLGEGLEATGYVYEGRQHAQDHDEREDIHLLGHGALGDDQSSCYFGDELDPGRHVSSAVHQRHEDDTDPER